MADSLLLGGARPLELMAAAFAALPQLSLDVIKHQRHRATQGLDWTDCQNIEGRLPKGRTKSAQT